MPSAIGDADLLEIAEAFVILCLGELVRLGHIAPADVNGRWHIRINADKLVKRGLAGAATVDDHHCAVLYLTSDLTVEGLMHVIAHEVVHLAQICRGDLIPMYGYQVWRGEPYPSLAADDPDYFSHQPWEVEAKALQPILLRNLQAKFSR
jgi:hypothetical protein